TAAGAPQPQVTDCDARKVERQGRRIPMKFLTELVIAGAGSAVSRPKAAPGNLWLTQIERK
ncbi:MAG: hypothetical protein ACREH8_09305, partial [Opitutaceae bacterium]